MTNATHKHISQWTGRDVHDSTGEKIGTVEQFWFDDQDGEPTWVSVKTGLFGLRQSFVPAEGLTEGANGELTTRYTKDRVKDAPNVDVSDDHLDPTEERRLYDHYEITTNPGRHTLRAGREDAERTDTEAGRRDTGGEAMTRSEEHLQVGTEHHEKGRARLRKYVVTETEQVDVPVTREEVRVEREPITDANRGEAVSGPAISEAEHEVTLHEERPVVDTEAVPVERVRLSKQQVTDTETVSGEVRQERIDTDVDDDTRR
ncbi:PRC and DUF2382 domain-containing protein [Amycolatopsis sp. cmx-4-61]|uniref:PRC and DUF2382 domain-containing protein n=1 Tax=Amycolatopsis sp. cmx-4-61 TaxID=2790937 RepID=UPI00397C4865